ncbi:hypothetical protein DFJ74DRAFT_503507 [Hyaloraphidium curvatum]|nr:hypothetical protein DFJ74DRAFT_503507 [Hyaloraphidium curvatum]
MAFAVSRRRGATYVSTPGSSPDGPLGRAFGLPSPAAKLSYASLARARRSPDADSRTLLGEESRRTPEDRFLGHVSQLAAVVFDSVWRGHGEGGFAAQPRTSRELQPFLHALLLSTRPITAASVLAGLFYVERLRKAHPTANGREGFEASVVTCALLLATKFWSEDGHGDRGEPAQVGLLDGPLDDAEDDDCACRCCQRRRAADVEEPTPYLGGDDFWRPKTYRDMAALDPGRRDVWDLATSVEDAADEDWQPGRRSNAYWARRAGIPLRDLTTMEAEFLSGLGFRLCIAPDCFLQWLGRVEEHVRADVKTGGIRRGRHLLAVVRSVREEVAAGMRRDSLPPALVRSPAPQHGPRRPADDFPFAAHLIERSMTPESVSSDATASTPY